LLDPWTFEDFITFTYSIFQKWTNVEKNWEEIVSKILYK